MSVVQHNELTMLRRKSNCRTAFTLLELLIVLGIIVILLGMGFPVLQRMYARNQLKATTQELQGELLRTRLQAMKSGKAYVFRYRFGSSVYEIIPKEIFDQLEKDKSGLGAVSVGSALLETDHFSDDYGSDNPISETVETDVLTSTDEIISINIYEKVLPHRIIFGNANNTSGYWSSPILFYPNGRTSQASIILKMNSRYSYQEELTLRGLTGTARITDP